MSKTDITANERFYYRTEQRDFSLSVCTCGYEKSDHGYAWGPGKRPYPILCHVERGSASYIHDGVTYTVREGDSFVSFPDKMQAIKSTGPWEYYWVGFTGSEAEKMILRAGFTPSSPVRFTKNNGTIKHLQHRIYDLRGTRLCDVTAMTGQLYMLFAAFYESLDAAPVDVHPDILQRALDYIHDNCLNGLTVADICKRVSASRSWLYRQFMENIGESPVQYITHQRLLVASHELVLSTLSVSDIAQKCGFSDSMYFSRSFKKFTGMSPLQFRRSMRSSAIYNYDEGKEVKAQED